jgi:hypothetical protein
VSRAYDAIIVGARCAGSPTAMLLARITCQLATLEPPPPEMQQLFGAIHGDQKAMDGFVQTNAGTISPAEFFSPANIGAIMAARATI